MKDTNSMTQNSPVDVSAARTAVASQTDFNRLVDLLAVYSEAENRLTQLQAADYLRQRTELNLETLASLSDDDLLRFRIKRIQGDTFSIKAARLDLGKAVRGKTTDARKGGDDVSRN